MNLFRRKKPTKIIESHVDVDPANLEASTVEGYLKRGLVYLARGIQDKAEADLRKVLTMNADSVDAHYNLGLIYKKQGKTGEAQSSFKTALEKIRVLEVDEPVRALMVSKLIKWQLTQVSEAG